MVVFLLSLCLIFFFYSFYFKKVWCHTFHIPDDVIMTSPGFIDSLEFPDKDVITHNNNEVLTNYFNFNIKIHIKTAEFKFSSRL